MGLSDEGLANPHGVSPTMRCSICHDVFSDAVFCGGAPCQHTFCRCCLQRWMAVSRECPTCRSPIHIKDLRSHEVMESLIDEIDMRCSVKACHWSGTRDALKGHLKECAVAMWELEYQKVSECLDKQRTDLCSLRERLRSVEGDYDRLSVLHQETCRRLEQQQEDHRRATASLQTKTKKTTSHLQGLLAASKAENLHLTTGTRPGLSHLLEQITHETTSDRREDSSSPPLLISIQSIKGGLLLRRSPANAAAKVVLQNCLGCLARTIKSMVEEGSAPYSIMAMNADTFLALSQGPQPEDCSSDRKCAEVVEETKEEPAGYLRTPRLVCTAAAPTKLQKQPEEALRRRLQQLSLRRKRQ